MKQGRHQKNAGERLRLVAILIVEGDLPTVARSKFALIDVVQAPGPRRLGHRDHLMAHGRECGVASLTETTVPAVAAVVDSGRIALPGHAIDA